MTEAQTHIDGLYPDKSLVIGELRPDPALTDKLTGELVIKNYPNITGIVLDSQELTKLKIINCPKLTKIDVGDNKLEILDFDKVKTHDDTETGTPDNSELSEITCRLNSELKKLSFKYCPKLETLLCQDCPNLHWLDLIENLKLLTSINLPNIRLLHVDKLEYYRDVVKAVREVLKIDPNDSLPKDPGTQKLIIDTLKERIKSSIIIQIEKEGGGFKTERDQLKQQIERVVEKLGLAKDATEIQILDKIQYLINKPPVVNTAKETELQGKIDEKDQEIANLRKQISDLKNNSNDGNSVTREEVIQKMESVSGIVVSEAKKEEIRSASSTVVAMGIGNKVFEEKLKNEEAAKKQAFYLNVALGALSIGTLLELTWLMLKENKLLIKEEVKKKKP